MFWKSSEKLKSKVVVIGGGCAGSTTAHALSKEFEDVTVIDKKTYYENTPAILKCLVDPAKFDSTRAELDVIFKPQGVKTITGAAVYQIDTEKKQVYFKKCLDGKEEEQSVEYDYLVICIGSDYPSQIKATNEAITCEQRKSEISKVYKKIEESKHIVIIGGGLVGVELLGELAIQEKIKTNNTKITLVHSKKQLLERTGEKAHDYVMNFAKKNKNVEILLNEKVKFNPEEPIESLSTIETESGKKIENVDLVFNCIGYTINNQCIKNSSKLKSCLNEQGQLKVNKYLQVEGFDNVFAFGDITDVKEEKQAYTAKCQTKVGVPNIITCAKNKRDNKQESLKAYDGMDLGGAISLGDNDAIVISKDKVMLTGWLAAKIKNKILYYAGMKPITHPNSWIKL